MQGHFLIRGFLGPLCPILHVAQQGGFRSDIPYRNLRGPETLSLLSHSTTFFSSSKRLPPCPILEVPHPPNWTPTKFSGPNFPLSCSSPRYSHRSFSFLKSCSVDYYGETDGGGGAQQQNIWGSCTKVLEIALVLESWLLFTRDSCASGSVWVLHGPPAHLHPLRKDWWSHLRAGETSLRLVLPRFPHPLASAPSFLPQCSHPFLFLFS